QKHLSDATPVQHPGMGNTICDPVARRTDRYGQSTGIHHPRPGEKCLALYLLQLASSTIQETSSSNECPACSACSGASEVGVMPGCVLISRQTSSPSGPTSSL